MQVPAATSGLIAGDSFWTIPLCILSVAKGLPQAVSALRRGSECDCCVQVPAAASGLIAGDGLWTIISCILSIAKLVPPVCMSFAGSAAAVAAAADPAAG